MIERAGAAGVAQKLVGPRGPEPSTEEEPKGILFEWVRESGRYFVPVIVEPCEEGFLSSAATLPGAVSEGDSEAEAIENIKEALAGLIESYRDAGADIPWQDLDGSLKPKVRWVTVDVG